MITLYRWNIDGSPGGSIECDETGPLPARCTAVVPPAAEPGQRVAWRGGAWVQEPLPEVRLEQLRAELIDAATAQRWAHETGGLTLNGVRVATALQDQNRIASVLAAMQVADLDGPDFMMLTGETMTALRVSNIDGVDFKAMSGWVYLTATELRGIAAAIAAHVQACFSAERAHHAAIAAIDSLAAAQDYDVSTGWPE